MKARVSNLHKTEEEWEKLGDWIPNSGEFVVYGPDDQYDYARMKVGDGKTPLKDLTFFIDSAISTFLQRLYKDPLYIDGGKVEHWAENMQK